MVAAIVLLVLVTAGTNLYAASVGFARIWAVGIPGWSHTVGLYFPCAAAVVTTVWLLGIARRGPQEVTRERGEISGPAAVVAAAILGGLAIYLAIPRHGQHNDSVVALGYSVVVSVVLATEVCRCLGLGDKQLGLDMSRTRTPGRARASVITAVLALCACWVGGASTMNVTVWFLRTGAPGVLRTTQDQAVGIVSTPQYVAQVVLSAGIEDVVIIGVLCTLLARIGRPAWQIYAVVVGLEVWLHAYLGIPALCMGLYAAGHVELYRRYRRMLPLVVGHMAFDLLTGYGWVMPVSAGRWMNPTLHWISLVAITIYVLVRLDRRYASGWIR